ncbi:uncharacterized protein TEOVI_000460400 [Trypanosoma equiperdum]|uniref:Uncharacterized protein n=1 Tax=Trypanosoma equiperdum TaxID=5694 RepID=A0A1G4IKY2_TRYEQ|nr:hypothetical protein TEOVI_000460400 [Trypanosoma equiperdum]
MDFRALNEDIMVGEVIRNKLNFEGLLTVDMQECRYVMNAAATAIPKTPKNSNVVVLHHINEDEYLYFNAQESAATATDAEPKLLLAGSANWKHFICGHGTVQYH